MKKIKYLIFSLFVTFVGVMSVKAAPSASFYTSSATVENGKSVTASVTISNVAAWNVKITSNGNTSGCNGAWADATSNGGNSTKTFSVTCKATSIGAIGFTLSGDATSQDGATINLSGSKRVTVVQPRPASKITELGSLEVVDYEIDPKFSEDVLEYTAKVPSTVNEVTIKASAKDKYATLTGDGTFEVNEGPNEFKIVVTAENGDTKEYKLTVIVEDPNPINLEIDGKKYTIVKNLKNIETPELFTASTIKIGETEVPSFVSDVSKFTLVSIKDESGKPFFAILNEDGSYSLYRTVNIGNLIFYIIDKEENFDNYEKTTLTIGDYEITAYRSNKDKDMYLVYGMNVSDNTEGWYRYDQKDSTLQRFDNSELENLKKKNKQYTLIIMIFGAGLLLSIIVCIISSVSSNKKVKKMALILASKRVEEVKANYAKNEEVKESKKEKKTKKEKKKKEKEPTILDETKEIKMANKVEETKEENVESKTIEMKDIKEPKKKKSKK